MKYETAIFCILFWFLALGGCHPRTPELYQPPVAIAPTKAPIDTPLNAAELYQPDLQLPELLHAVQMQRLFKDGKTFVDMRPKMDPAQIAVNYQVWSETRGQTQTLEAFVAEHFYPLDTAPADTHRQRFAPQQDMVEHINQLWPLLMRPGDKESMRSPHSSLIPLPYAYTVPGGRFREIYYWDSYFTLHGLILSEQSATARDMVRNFASLIDRFGRVPNGNRTYYLSRSQPPFFAAMVALLRRHQLTEAGEFLPQLEAEYAFWMTGEQGLAKGEARQRVVRFADGSVLNRYFDDVTTPRPESYREDVHTAAQAKRPPKDVYRHLRAAAESGWDFSSRWLEDGHALASIRTTDIVPIDLNSLLYQLEQEIAVQHALRGDHPQAATYETKARQRKAAIHRWLWDAKAGHFGDRLFFEDRFTHAQTLAMVFPLYFELATPTQAAQTGRLLEDLFLKPGGLVTTLHETGQQWDYPNGWAPLQWLAVQGLEAYNQRALARQVAERWLALNQKVYRDTGRMMEKYNVVDLSLEAGGGEYPTQDGFGWTNGVALALKRYLETHRATLTAPAISAGGAR